MRALLLHSDPGELLPFLEGACAGAEWCAASTPDEVGPALQAHGPEVVFSIKHSGFPGDAHRPAIEAPSVRWFHIGGSGREHLGHWDGSRVVVTDCAGVLAPFLAERTVAGLLALATGLPEAIRAQARGEWVPTRFRPVAGRTLLLVGVGHCGGEVARLGKALGMRVLGVRRQKATHPEGAHPHIDEMFTPHQLLDVLPLADVVSLHVRLDASTRHLFSAEAFSRLKPGALFLNAARGAVVDTAALLEALDGNVAGAWLDVFEEEPLPAGHPLWQHDRVLVSPHCADQADDWPLRFAHRFAENWGRRQRGEALIGLTPTP